MSASFLQLVEYLSQIGIDRISHTRKTYLDHLTAVYKLMTAEGCSDELCRAGMFHSIYGTERFQGFTLPLSAREELRQLIGAHAEQLAYWNCFMDRASFDEALQQPSAPYEIRHRETGERMRLTQAQFDDLCRVHLYDWLEQAPRSRFGWDYRRQAYRRMAEHLGQPAIATYDRIYAREHTDEPTDKSNR